MSRQSIPGLNPAFKVGGPATAGAAWVPEMIAFCSMSHLPLDFISTHTYGVNQGFLDEFGGSGTVLSKDKWSVSGDMWKSRRQIASSKMPNLELHYTEWSASYTPADPIHDSYHEAAYILEKIKQAGNAVNSMSYWTFTDIFEEAGPRFTPFHGGFGLLNTQGIQKPAYHAFAYLNKLGSTELKNADSSSYVCKDGKGGVQVLFWDQTYTLPDSVNNQAYYVRDLPAKAKGTVKVALKGLTMGIHTLEVYRTGYRYSDAYTAYSDMGRPNQLSKLQVDILNQQSRLEPLWTASVKVAADGLLTKEFLIRENDVFLVLVK
jgi:xylan 1,4-beta-xylosidase